MVKMLIAGRVRCLLIVAGAACLGGCAGRSAPELPVGTARAVPMASVAPAAYRIGPLDVLRIDVLQEPSLTIEELTVDAGGSISLPLVGDVPAAGMTASETAAEISTRLAPFIRVPRVSVNVVQARSKRVTVSGAVNEAGMFEAPGGVTLMQAIALAQGASEFAKLDEVVVFRTQNGERTAARFDLGAIQGGAAADPLIQSGDVVVVGVSNARRLFRDILTVLPFAAGIFIPLAD